MKTQSGLRPLRFLPLFFVLVLALAAPASVHAACYNGRCPVGEYDEEEREVEITITFTIAPEEAGTIEVDGDLLEDSTFETFQGTEVVLEAVAESGWEFESWSGSMSSEENPWTTPFYNHKYLTANFTRSGSGDEDEEEDGDGVEVGASVEIDDDTVAVDADGDPFSEIEVDVKAPHDAPSDSLLIGNVYDLGPDGAEFDPPVPLTISYERGLLPDGVAARELVVAWLDEGSGEWVALESTVDEDARVVVAEVSHFSEFCLMAPKPEEYVAPLTAPGFSFSGLEIVTADAQVGQPIDVSVTASYNGEQPTASSQVQLLVNGQVADTAEVSLASGESTTVGLSAVAETDGTHAIEVNGLQATIDVWPATAPTALSDAVALAEEDTFEAPAFSLPTLPSLPGLPSLSLPSLSIAGNWPIGIVIGGAVVLFLILLPLLRRRILRYRYDI
ncbi:CARDB domain-containing protein [Chloroflexota bacterium]